MWWNQRQCGGWRWIKRVETQKEKSAFVFQHKRADKEPQIPDHQAWDLWMRACKNKKRPTRAQGAFEYTYTCVCVRTHVHTHAYVPDRVHKCLPDLSGEWVQARKQFPIVRLGVMRAVMRAWVSWAAHYKCQASREPVRRVSVKMERLIAATHWHSPPATQAAAVTLVWELSQLNTQWLTDEEIFQFILARLWLFFYCLKWYASCKWQLSTVPVVPFLTTWWRQITLMQRLFLLKPWK